MKFIKLFFCPLFTIFFYEKFRPIWKCMLCIRLSFQNIKYSFQRVGILYQIDQLSKIWSESFFCFIEFFFYKEISIKDFIQIFLFCFWNRFLIVRWVSLWYFFLMIIRFFKLGFIFKIFNLCCVLRHNLSSKILKFHLNWLKCSIYFSNLLFILLIFKFFENSLQIFSLFWSKFFINCL